MMYNIIFNKIDTYYIPGSAHPNSHTHTPTHNTIHSETLTHTHPLTHNSSHTNVKFQFTNKYTQAQP